MGHIPNQKRDSYIGALLGAILIKVKDPPHKWKVTRKEFDEILQNESVAYVKSIGIPLPNVYRQIKLSHDQIRSYDNERFVSALREIEYEKEITNAISDYWKMEKTVMDYFQNDPTYCADLESYTDDLHRKLEYEKDKKETELEDNPNIKKINISKRLYINVMSWKAEDFGSIIRNQDFFQRGTIHNIVNTTDFRWKVGDKENEH